MVMELRSVERRKEAMGWVNADIEVEVSRGIDCGGFHYSIRVDDRAKAELGGANCIGRCSISLQEILIDNSLTPSQFSETFIHECVEAVNHSYLNNSLEHKEISVLANGLHQVMESLGVRFVVKEKG